MEDFGLRKRKNSKKKPSNAYYLGYVEDDETPEMIMRKFEQLEKLEKQKPDDVVPLDERAQEQLFTLTSSVLVQHSLSEAEKALTNYLEYDDVNLDNVDNLDMFFSDGEEQDDDDDANYEMEHVAPSHYRRRSGKRNVSSGKKGSFLQIGGKFIIQKRKIYDDLLEIEDIKLPENPLTIAWAKTIRPFEKFVQKDEFYLPFLDKTDYYETDNIIKFDFKSVNAPFNGVLIHDTKNLSKLPLDTIIPYGYLFLFIEKQDICTVMDDLKKFKFDYVENMAWVKQNLNGTFRCDKAKYLGKSHLTLFIFKRENQDKKMDIRHQRNPDTIFDFVKPLHFVYHLIETLIPNGRFLELYGEKNKKKEGWIKIFEKNKYDF